MGNINLNQTENGEPNLSPPYFLSLLGFVPSVGLPIGLGLILYGIFEYKSKKLIATGISCMLLATLIFSSFYYIGLKSDFAKNIWEEQAQLRLNHLADNIEHYKSAKGHYPDNLRELTNYDETVPVNDPMVSIGKGKKINFYYKNLGLAYSIYSAGKDEIPNTKDDLFPKIINGNTLKPGK